MDKTDRQIRIEYLTSESEDEWLAEELADFFADGADRSDAAEQALARASHGFEDLMAYQITENDMVAFCISVLSSEGDELATTSFFSLVPSPETLLLYCSRTADPDDTVVVVFTYIDGLQLAFDAVWPFGMDKAVELTTMPELAGIHDHDVENSGMGQLNATIERAGREMAAAVHRGVHGALDRLGVDDNPVRAAGVGACVAALATALLMRSHKR